MKIDQVYLNLINSILDRGRNKWKEWWKIFSFKTSFSKEEALNKVSLKVTRFSQKQSIPQRNFILHFLFILYILNNLSSIILFCPELERNFQT